MARKLSPSYGKLPKIVQAIQRNHSVAYAHLRRLAFVKLVYVSSGGPGGDGPTDNYGDKVLQDELDAAIDQLQDLVDKQQQQLASVGGSSSGGGEAADKPCQEYLLRYQAALVVNDGDAAQKYLDQYSNCLQVNSENSSSKKKSSD